MTIRGVATAQHSQRAITSSRSRGRKSGRSNLLIGGTSPTGAEGYRRRSCFTAKRSRITDLAFGHGVEVAHERRPCGAGGKAQAGVAAYAGDTNALAVLAGMLGVSQASAAELRCWPTATREIHFDDELRVHEFAEG